MITHISPLGSMDLLSQMEVDMLKRTASSDLYRLFRNCSLAVLNSGAKTDNSTELLSRFETFDINVLRRERGVKLELVNPPEEAFVDGRIIRALQANLFAVLRDILFVNGQLMSAQRAQAANSSSVPGDPTGSGKPDHHHQPGVFDTAQRPLAARWR